MNSAILFSLLYLLIEIKHFVKGFDVRKDIWYRNTEDKSTFSDDIRCFCNLPQCVSTGYMCRTARSGNNSGCFSEINKSTTIEPIITTATRHGCIELLNISNERYYCDKNPTKLKLKLSAQNKQNRDYHETTATTTEFLLICCHEDMCNHIDNPENQKLKLDISENIDLSMNAGKYQSIHHHNLQQQQKQQQQLQNKQNHPINIEQIQIQKQLSSSSPSLSSSQLSQSSLSPSTISMIFSSPGRSNNDDWFRVATIAVPICGAFILFSLIAIAIKILRTDRSTSISLKLDNNSTSSGGIVGSSIPITTSINTTTTTSTIKDCKLDRKFILLDNEAQIIKHHNLQQQSSSSSSLSSPSSHLLEQYSINNCNNLLNSNNCNTFDNNYCDKKNETRAKMNQLLNIQYTLLPQNSTTNYNYDDSLLTSSSSSSSSSPSSLLLYHNHDKLSNNYNIDIQSLINNTSNNYNSKLFYKNLNNNCNNNINISNNSSSSSTSSSSSSSQNNNMMIIDKHNKIYAKDILSPICENWNDDNDNENDDNHSDDKK